MKEYKETIGSTILNANKVLCKNPHWIGDRPAWDIVLSNGVIHEHVTDKDIGVVLAQMEYRGLITNGPQYICGCVRNLHITLYDKWFTVYSEEPFETGGK